MSNTEKVCSDGKKFLNQGGQTLIVLLIFVLVAVSVTTASIFIVTANSLASSDSSRGITTKQMADSGIETAYLKILRDPTYSGETISDLEGGSVTITVSWVGSTGTIVSTAINGSFTRTVESVVTTSQNVLNQVSWKEIN